MRSDDFFAMGTEVSLVSADDERRDLTDVFAEVREIFSRNEAIFSRFRSESELSRLNDALGKRISVSEEMFEVLEKALKYHRLTRGYFDPRVIEVLESIGYERDFFASDPKRVAKRSCCDKFFTSSWAEEIELDRSSRTVRLEARIDLSGLVKSVTVSQSAEFLRLRGLKNFIIDAGGDMFVSGCASPGEKWRIAVEGIDCGKFLPRLTDTAVATSGRTRRWWSANGKKVHHLVNPFSSDEFSFRLQTVTVFADSPEEADIWAKTLFLMGPERGRLFSEQNALRAVFVDNQGNFYSTSRV